MPKPWNKLIVALDLTSQKKIKEVIKTLSPKVKKFKVGLIAYTRFGPKIINWAKEAGADVFLDFKLYDIPNTMIETAKTFIESGVWAFTVHLKAGQEALESLKGALTKEARLRKKRRPLIIGVTELTSQKASLNKVLQLAEVARKSKIDGVVCSVWEAKQIKEKFGLCTITPGIRAKKEGDDQKRIATVKDALKNRVDYFVVGRPIIKEKDYLKAANQILAV
ncbi:MAG: orotidine-5'-phosphate decarboxylase [Candidatus Omnitrophota bacterium]|nr:MAG: orotidine-5'-phosphate decarboxylase [Candidatus Omnitrophota bacterium]